jgi:hypothetical protein
MTKKAWSVSEVEWLVNNYPDLGLKASCEHLDRTLSSVRHKASKLCLRVVRRIRNGRRKDE